MLEYRLDQDTKDAMRAFEPQFKTYCRRIRGYSSVPSGVEAIILWVEFIRGVVLPCQEALKEVK